MDLEHEKRLTEVEARSKSNTKRLDELAPIIQSIHKMSETMVELTSEIRHTNEEIRQTNQSVEEIKDKVNALETEPLERWNHIRRAFFNAMVGAFGAAMAGGIIYLLTLGG